MNWGHREHFSLPLPRPVQPVASASDSRPRPASGATPLVEEALREGGACCEGSVSSASTRENKTRVCVCVCVCARVFVCVWPISTELWWESTLLGHFSVSLNCFFLNYYLWHCILYFIYECVWSLKKKPVTFIILNSVSLSQVENVGMAVLSNNHIRYRPKCWSLLR